MSSTIDTLKRLTFEIQNNWKSINTSGLNQTLFQTIEELITSLESVINSPEFQRLSPNDILKSVGYDLWNVCVEQTKKKPKVLMDSSITIQSDLKLQIIRARKIACDIVEKSVKLISLTSKQVNDILRLYIKTGRDALIIIKEKRKDLKLEQVNSELNDMMTDEIINDPNEFNLPIFCFEKATTYSQKFLELHPNNNNASQDKFIESALSNILNAFIDKAECFYLGKNLEACFSSLQFAKKIVERIPTEIHRIAMQEYNYAYELQNQSNFEESVRWLKDSFELYELDENKQPAKQVRTLRLLCNAYIQIESYDNAMNCIKMANQMLKTSPGMFLEVKINTILKREDEIQRTIFEMIKYTETALDLSLAACQFVTENNYFQISKKSYRLLLELYENNQQEYIRISLKYFDLLIHYFSNEQQSVEEAFSIVEKVTQLSKTPMDRMDESNQVLKEFQNIIWSVAYDLFLKKDYQMAISFYKKSLELMPMDDIVNRAKALRSIAKCYLYFDKIEEAMNYGEDANQLDSKSFHTHYLMYQIHLKSNNLTNANEFLRKMKMDEDFKANIYALAAQDAYKQGAYDCVLLSLEGLLDEDSFDKRLSVERGTILRSLAHLSYSKQDYDKLLTYFEKTINYVKSEGLETVFKRGEENESIEWFHRAAWNSANDCVQSKNDLEKAYQFFRYATLFYTYREVSVESLSSQRYCYLMRIHCALGLARQSPEYLNGNEWNFKTKEMLQSALQEVEQCKKVINALVEFNRKESHNIMQDTNTLSNDTKRDKIYPYVYVAEIQLMVLLQCNEGLLIDVINSISRLENVGLNIFELVCSVCLESKNISYYNAAKHSLQIALKKILLGTSPNYSKAIMLYASLIQICKTREESFAVFEELLKLLNQIKPNEQFFKTEYNNFIWFTTESWNNSVYFYKSFKYDKAEEWMKIAMKLCCFLDQEEELVKSISEQYAVAFDRFNQSSFKTPRVKNFV
ncbi:hypothetical protein ABK040_008189 [Willaertia magna]